MWQSSAVGTTVENGPQSIATSAVVEAKSDDATATGAGETTVGAE
ncbi:hypothetical protein [Halorientalis sp.]|jgi:hypothetical protein|nr:hypothetical protein [Halorientalis sp.]